MFTKEQLLQAIPDIPAEFSLAELEAVLSRPRPSTIAPARPANLTPEQAADWEYYSSPEARALHNRHPVPPEIKALYGIAASLSEEDKQKTAKEWEAERIKEKYGI